MPRMIEINPHFPGARLEGETLSPEARTGNILHDTIEMAGHRDLEASAGLLSERLAAVRRKKHDGELRLSRAASLSEIIKTNEKKISEGALTYVQIEDDATIINASDAHGSFADLSIPIAEFIRRRESGENVYFNFSGDVSSGDVDEVVPCMEALASLQVKYPNEVTVELGNGDRRGTSLMMGLSREAARRFAPALHQELEELATGHVADFAAESGLDEKKARATRNFFYGAELLRLARLGGAQPLDPHDLNANFLQRLAGGMVGAMNLETPSMRGMVGALKSASEPLRPWERAEISEAGPEILEQARQVFEYWKLADSVLNEQPALAIYESPSAVVLASHTGFVGTGQNLGELAYNPTKLDEAVWNKIIHPERGEVAGSVEKYGPFISFPPEFQGEILARILPPNKTAVLLTGHNHGNFAERIPAGNRDILRVENCVSHQPKRAGAGAAFVEVRLRELAKNSNNPETAVTFKMIADVEA